MKRARWSISHGGDLLPLRAERQMHDHRRRRRPTAVQQPAKANPLMREIHLLAGSDTFTLLTNYTRGNSNRVRGGLIPADSPLVSGDIYCLRPADRTAEMASAGRGEGSGAAAHASPRPADSDVCQRLTEAVQNGWRPECRCWFWEKRPGAPSTLRPVAEHRWQLLPGAGGRCFDP